jgi:hypothetical protein
MLQSGNLLRGHKSLQRQESVFLITRTHTHQISEQRTHANARCLAFLGVGLSARQLRLQRAHRCGVLFDARAHCRVSCLTLLIDRVAQRNIVRHLQFLQRVFVCSADFMLHADLRDYKLLQYHSWHL